MNRNPTRLLHVLRCTAVGLRCGDRGPAAGLTPGTAPVTHKRIVWNDAEKGHGVKVWPRLCVTEGLAVRGSRLGSQTDGIGAGDCRIRG